MKAGIFYGPRDMRAEDIELPAIGQTDVLIKVKAAGICGSDLHSYRQGVFFRPGWVMGHEFTGEAVEVGAKVKNIKKGDRLVRLGGGGKKISTEACGKCFWCQRGLAQYCEAVGGARKPCGKCKYCLAGQWYLCTELLRYQGPGYGRNGGCAEYVIIFDAVLNTNVFKLPDGVSYDEGVCLEPLTGGIKWIAQTHPQAYETAVVTGMGAIGLSIMQILKTKVSKVIVSDVSARRLAVAKELGADYIIDASKEDPVQKVIEITGVGRSRSGKGGGRADLVMECSGAGPVLQQTLEMTRVSGRINLVGLFEKPATIDPNLIVFKDLRLISSQGDFPGTIKELIFEAFDLVTSGKVKLKPMISHEFPIEKINEAFACAANSAESVRVLVKPK
jgi:threonine dehydrogenase-like Zn-dependent dehydrogenase